MLIQMLTLTVLQYNRKKSNREHVLIFIAKNITEKLTL